MDIMNSIPVVVILCIVFIAVLSVLLVFIRKKCHNRKLAYTLFALGLVFAFRFWVNLSGKVETGDGLPADNLSFFEKISDSLIHSLQTFSMDEDYTQYTVLGKNILADNSLSNWAGVYGFVISILNIAAPILGGALLLEILTGIFPIISIRIRPFRQKFVFSELNDEAICLAEDIAKNYKKIIKTRKFSFRPLIIFTDAYVDDELESSSELLNRAKKLGAICVKTDLTNLSLSWSKSVTYLLIDHKVSDSITAFSSLVNYSGKKPNWPVANKAIKRFSLLSTVPEDFCLSENDLANTIHITGSLIDMQGNKIEDDADFHQYISDCTIKSHENGRKTLCVNFNFSKRPLDNSQKISVSIVYPEVSADERKQDLVEEKIILSRTYEPAARFYIFVQDSYEAEMVYTINSRSRNASNMVLRVIRDYMNTSINLMHKAPLFLPLLESKVTDKHCNDLYITIFGSGNITEEVFKTIYWCGQMQGVKLHIKILSENAEDFERRIRETCPELLKSKEKGAAILKIFPKGSDNSCNPPYIEEFDCIPFQNVFDFSAYPEDVLKKTNYYVVALGSDENNLLFTDMLSKQLGRMRLTESCPQKIIIVPAVFNTQLAEAVKLEKADENGIHVIPFATLKERFSCRNVFMTDFAEDALSTEKSYNYANSVAQQNDEYTYWANQARAIHAPYKLFGFGLLEWDDETKEIKVKSGASLGINSMDLDDKAHEPTETEHQLAWIEHRRWNAFLRAQGFQCPNEEQFKCYFRKTRKHKNLTLKLHPCLVESQKIKQPLVLPESESFDETKYDALDYAAISVFYAKYKDKPDKQTLYRLQKEEFKQWDYIKYDAALRKMLGLL